LDWGKCAYCSHASLVAASSVFSSARSASGGGSRAGGGGATLRAACGVAETEQRTDVVSGARAGAARYATGGIGADVRLTTSAL
jgi:hypothetical protein